MFHSQSRRKSGLFKKISMSTEINQLIKYLRLRRRSDEFEKNKEPNNTVTLSVLGTDDSYIVLRNEFENFTLFERIVNQLEILTSGNRFFFINTISPNVKEYYIRKTILDNQTYQYKKINENNWMPLNIDGFQTVEIDLGTNTYFYDSTKNYVVTSSANIDDILITSDSFPYNPDDIAHIDNGVYKFDYENHAGDSLLASYFKRVYETSLLSQREVLFSKKTEKKTINLVPFLKKNTVVLGSGYPFEIVVPYIIKQKNMTGATQYFFSDCLTFKFNFIGSFLEFLNGIIFNDNPDFLDNCESRVRQTFKKDYLSILEQSFSRVNSSNYRDILIVLKYVPKSCYKYIPKITMWQILEFAIENNTINNRRKINEEDLVLPLLKAIAEQEKPTRFLSELLVIRRSIKSSYFKVLFNKINNGNFIEYVSFLNEIWFQSSFKNPENVLYKNNKSPFVVNYEAKKEFTFFYSNKNISWTEDNLLKFEPDSSWWDEVATVLHPALGEVVKEFTETEKSFYYHPFQPIAINNFDKQQTGITLTAPLLPAFILKAGEDVAFWDNVTTATEYVVDIVTTFSGVGNIVKFRHLAKVASKANKLKFVSRTGKALANAKAVARGTIGVIEISSGTVNALLKITNVRDEEWAKELSEFLLILEILALGADLSEFLLKRARTSAKNALKYEDEIRKQLDDVVIEDGKTTRKFTEADKGKFLDELNEVAELDNLAKWDDLPISGKGFLGGKTLRRKEIKFWIDEINRISKGKSRLIVLRKGDPILNNRKAGFDPYNGNIYVEKGLTEYEIFHEFKHLEEFMKLGKDDYIKGMKRFGGSPTENALRTYKREKYVFDEILKIKTDLILNN